MRLVEVSRWKGL